MTEQKLSSYNILIPFLLGLVMIDLQDLCALPISFNNQKGSLTFGDELLHENSEFISLKSLVPSLLNKSLRYPEKVYLEYYNVRHAEDNSSFFGNDLIYDVIYLPEGLLGVEYIKSHIFHTLCDVKTDKTSSIVEVLFGTLTVLLQKNRDWGDELSYYTEVEEGIVVTVRTGEKAVIPAGYFYTFINIEEKPVIFSRVYKKKSLADYSIFRKEQGLAYFCIRKNARCEIVRNPRYRNTPDVKYLKAADTLEQFKLQFSSPLYHQIHDHLDIFLEILWG